MKESFQDEREIQIEVKDLITNHWESFYLRH